MKKTILTFTLFIAALAVEAQNNGPSNQERILQIDAEIEKAVASQDYQKAADLQKEKGIREELEKAVQAQNYTKAAELQQQLENPGSGNNSRLAELERRLQSAIDQEQYAKAASLKKEIEKVKNGGSGAAPLASSAPSHTNAAYGAVPEPEFNYQVAYYSKADNRLTKLEKETPELKTSGWAAPGYAQSSSFYVLEGEKSPVRLTSGSGLAFVVRIPGGIDPSDYFRLVKFDVRRGRRYMEYFTASGTGWGGGDAGTVSEFDQEISFKRVKEGMYLITPDASLAAGEYTFYYSGNKMYAFGIDR